MSEATDTGFARMLAGVSTDAELARATPAQIAALERAAAGAGPEWASRLLARAARARLLADYESWATGETSEISDAAMCVGSARYRAANRAVAWGVASALLDDLLAMTESEGERS